MQTFAERSMLTCDSVTSDDVASMKLPVIDQRISTGYLLFTPARKMRSDDGAGISSGVDLGSSPNSDEGALITLVEVSA